MLVEIEIEYQDGEELEYVTVELETYPSRENDSFDYSYGSINATCKMEDYAIFDNEITWNKKKYTDKENAAIAAHIVVNFSEVEKLLYAAL